MGVFTLGGFVGEFRHSLDDKGRLTIPSQWRPDPKSEDNKFLALASPGGHIAVYPPKMIDKLEAAISEISLGDVKGQKAVAELMSKAHLFSCDKSGRINLNEKLIKHAKISKGAVLLGTLSTFSIYSEELFDAQQADESYDPEETAAVYQRFGL